MTRQLRQRHRRLWFVLGVLLPIVFITGLLVRRTVPVMAIDAAPFNPPISPFSPR